MDEVVNLLPDRIPVLVVDDDETVIQVTRLVLSRYRFDGRALELLCASTGKEAIQILSRRTDIAIVLLDVVMESDDSGFAVVSFIRNQQKNHVSRILLRTGQPGLAPERQVIVDYDINDYIAKTEATTDRLNLSITNALRSYRDILRADYFARRVMVAELEQQQAQQASQAKSVFLAHMSHEIRTPLNGIIGMAEILADTPLSEEQQGYLKDIHNSGRALLGIVNDVLDLSKIEAGKLELDPREFKLSEVLSELNSMFHAALFNKSIHYSVHVSKSVPDVLFADNIRLQQLVMNLLSNALKFTPEGGRVDLTVDANTAEHSMECGQCATSKLKAHPHDIQLILSVTDTGIGIDESRTASIFDAYQQAESSTSRVYGGTGLGLSLCRQIAQLMQGDICVQSALGEGACFTACLTVRRVMGEASEDEVLDDGVSVAGLTVLVAEDNPTSGRVINMLLKKLAVEAVVVSNGRELLECFEQVNPDVILMDCHMPVLDGFAATLALRERGVAIPILALTAGVTLEERQNCMSIGMNEVLTKPVNLESLSSALQRAVKD